jgi:signal transduction histidine kinase
MEVRARVRRALPRPSPRVRLARLLRVVGFRERREVVEVLSAAERARLLREFVAARARERRALWERLHDDVLQTTAGNLLRLDAARMLLEEGREEEARTLLAESSRTERQLFDILRRLMAEMNVEPTRMPSEDPLQVVVAVPEPDPASPVG